MTHEPTGVFVEGSTHLTDATFTKQRLRTASEKLMVDLLEDLEKKVLRLQDTDGT